MVALSQTVLDKRDNWATLADKISNGEPLKVGRKGDEGEVIIDPQVELLAALNLRTFDGTDFKVGTTINLPLKGTGTIRLNNLYKDTAFGGTRRTGTEQEDREITMLNDQLFSVMNATGSMEVTVRIGSQVVNVARAESTSGTPKSDFHLLNANGKRVAWISHKQGKSAKDFSQWGGMTERCIKDHPEVKQFAEDVRQMFSDGIPAKTTVARKISDAKLKAQAMYGRNFGAQHEDNNVNVIVQGPVKLKQEGVWYTLDGNLKCNGISVDGTEYEPALMAIYKGDRSNFGVKGARFSIYPAEGRKVNEWV